MASKAIDRFPTYLNGTALDFFPQIENAPEKIQNVNKSEGGKRIIQTIRTERWSHNFTIAVADRTWVAFFAGLNKLDSFIFRQYDPAEDDYISHTVQMENFKYGYRKKSEKLTSVTGIWDVSFTLEEF